MSGDQTWAIKFTSLVILVMETAGFLDLKCEDKSSYLPAPSKVCHTNAVTLVLEDDSPLLT